MVVTLFPIVTLAKLLQAENAEFPMLVTLLGIVTPVRLMQESNADVPMLVTGLSVMLAGIAIGPTAAAG